MGRRSEQSLTPQQLRRIIATLDERQSIAEGLEREIARRNPHRSPPWYRSQKEHWLGWLAEYNGPGFYQRSRWDRSAQFVYNHIQCPPMLVWLAEASGLPRARILRAKGAALAAGNHYGASAAAIRSHLPWGNVEKYFGID